MIKGNNSAETPKGKVTVPGFAAKRGFDVASGWGTMFAPRFVPALVAATAPPRGGRGPQTGQGEARALEHAVQLSPSTWAPTARATCSLPASCLTTR